MKWWHVCVGEKRFQYNSFAPPFIHLQVLPPKYTTQSGLWTTTVNEIKVAMPAIFTLSLSYIQWYSSNLWVQLNTANQKTRGSINHIWISALPCNFKPTIEMKRCVKPIKCSLSYETQSFLNTVARLFKTMAYKRDYKNEMITVYCNVNLS